MKSITCIVLFIDFSSRFSRNIEKIIRLDIWIEDEVSPFVDAVFASCSTSNTKL